MINTIIQVLVSVIIPGLILAFVSKRLNRTGPRLLYYVSAATWFTNMQPQQQAATLAPAPSANPPAMPQGNVPVSTPPVQPAVTQATVQPSNPVMPSMPGVPGQQ